MDKTARTFEIYDFLREHKETAFSISEIEQEMNDRLKDYEDEDGSIGVTVSNKMVRESLDDLVAMGRAERDTSTNAHQYQMAQGLFEDDSEDKALAKALLFSMYRSMGLDRLDISINKILNLEVNREESRLIEKAADLLEVSDSNTYKFDSELLKHLSVIVGCYKDKYWANIFVNNPETGEPYDKPIKLAPVKIFMQNRRLHCFGIIRKNKSFTGTRIIIDDIHKVERGANLRIQKDRKEAFLRLKERIQTIRDLPEFYA